MTPPRRADASLLDAVIDGRPPITAYRDNILRNEAEGEKMTARPDWSGRAGPRLVFL